MEKNSPSPLLFPSPLLKKVPEEKKEQTKVYDHAEPVHAWSKMLLLKLGIFVMARTSIKKN